MPTLHFSLGKNFGKVLHQISREHLTNRKEFDYKKAYACFSDSGAPYNYWLKLLSGEYLITVDDNGIDCYIVPREQIDKEELLEYPDILTKDFLYDYLNDTIPSLCKAYKDLRYNYSKICNYTLRLSKEDLDYLYGVGISDKIKYHFRAYMDLTIDDVMNLWYDCDEKIVDMLMNQDDIDEFGIGKCQRTYNSRLSDLFNDLSYIKRELDICNNFTKTSIWLCEQYGWRLDERFYDFVNIVKALSYIMVMTKEKHYKDLETFFEEDWLATKVNQIVEYKSEPKTQIDSKFVTQSQVDDIIEEYIENKNSISPVDISNYFDAGFISPDGLVYAMRGNTCDLIHIQLADILWEQYDLGKTVRSKYSLGKDFEMMKLGWVKFHHSNLYYDATYYGNMTFDTKLPSKKVLEIIDSYALNHWEGHISINNHHVDINKNQLSYMSEGELKEIFDY